LKMCVDYKAFNKVIMKNRYPLLQIDDLFDWLLGAKVFSNISLLTFLLVITLLKVSKWVMQAHFRHVGSKRFPMI
jgi:hypothetical protein